jgi:hypothetical protein
MALTNAERQRRCRERNVVVLTDRAEDIAEKLIDMEDQAKLRKVARLIGNHLKNPNRSHLEAGRSRPHSVQIPYAADTTNAVKITV